MGYAIVPVHLLIELVRSQSSYRLGCHFLFVCFLVRLPLHIEWLLLVDGSVLLVIYVGGWILPDYMSVVFCECHYFQLLEILCGSVVIFG